MFKQSFWKNWHHQQLSQVNKWAFNSHNHLSCSKLLMLKVIFWNLQDNSDCNNTENKQEKLSEIQFLKIHCTAEDYK